MALLRPGGEFAGFPFIATKQTSVGNRRFFLEFGLKLEAQPTFVDDCSWSHVDPEQTCHVSLPDLLPRMGDCCQSPDLLASIAVN